MCAGVTKGLAGIKLSGSPRRYGSNKVNNNNLAIITSIPTISFNVK